MLVLAFAGHDFVANDDCTKLHLIPQDGKARDGRVRSAAFRKIQMSEI
jgi:hypothetical protein